METTWSHIKPYREINEAEKALVAALRSGKYVQDKMVLRGNNGYCCLGVACEISGLGSFSEEEGWGFSFKENGYTTINTQVLPLAVLKAIGWKSDIGVLRIDFLNESRLAGIHWSLTGLNDSGYTFDQIASIIELGAVELA